MRPWKVRLLYDGACPICRREIDWLRRRNLHGYLDFEDISDPAFDPSRYGLTREQVTRVLHGVLPDGRVARGLEAVRQAYRAVGLGWLVAPSGWPGLRRVADAFYLTFARLRMPLGHLLCGHCKPRPHAARKPCHSPSGLDSSCPAWSNGGLRSPREEQ